LTNAQFTDGGDYTVVVSHIGWFSHECTSTLTVHSMPIITQPPQSQLVKVATDAAFSVTAIGSSPFSYQWRFNQSEIMSATASAYTRSNGTMYGCGQL